MRRISRLMLLGACLCAAQALSEPCEGVTGIVGCIECIAASKQCYLCHKSRWPAFDSKTGRITACKASVACPINVKRDPECAKCDSSGWCYQCQPDKYFDANYNCVPNGAAKGTCQQVSKNAECAACNPDNTCKLCSSASKLVVPMNAIYINMPGSESQCLTLAQVKSEGLDLVGATPALPSLCREVTSDFKCARCAAGYSYSPTTNKCTKYGDPGGSGCTGAAAPNLPYREYCAKCGKNAAGKTVCKSCTWGRVLDRGGRCSLNCKRLWGIGCLQCTAAACTKVDPAYAKGRR